MIRLGCSNYNSPYGGERLQEVIVNRSYGNYACQNNKKKEGNSVSGFVAGATAIVATLALIKNRQQIPKILNGAKEGIKKFIGNMKIK